MTIPSSVLNALAAENLENSLSRFLSPAIDLCCVLLRGSE